MSFRTFEVWALLSLAASAATFVGCIVLTRLGWFG